MIGNQYGVWREAKHAQAFETLKGEKALEIAEEKGLAVPPHQAEQCLECHVTGYGADPSKFARRPLAPEDGVQCESCHGPGSLYRKKKIMSDREKAVAAGMCEADKDDKICAACHNEDSPVVPEEGFDFAKLREGTQHPIPEDVKGRYLEIEKQLKAERQAEGEAVEEE